jgi:hypothetical protein
LKRIRCLTGIKAYPPEFACSPYRYDAGPGDEGGSEKIVFLHLVAVNTIDKNEP